MTTDKQSGGFEKAREREKIVLECLGEEWSLAEIAKKTGLSRIGVYDVIKRLKKKKLIPEELAFKNKYLEREKIVLESINNGLSIQDIAWEAGISKGRVYNYIRRLEKKGLVPMNLLIKHKPQEFEKIVLEFINKGLSFSEIARETSLTYQRVRVVFKRLEKKGLISEELSPKNKSKEREKMVLEFINNGLSFSEIARETGLTYGGIRTVFQRLKNNGLIQKRDKEFFNKQAQEREKIVLEFVNKGLSNEKIAEKTGLSNGGVYAITARLRVKGLISEEIPRKTAKMFIGRERQRIVLKCLDENGGLSIREIIEKTGLPKVSVYSIINNLLNKKLLAKENQNPNFSCLYEDLRLTLKKEFSAEIPVHRDIPSTIEGQGSLSTFKERIMTGTIATEFGKITIDRDRADPSKYRLSGFLVDPKTNATFDLAKNFAGAVDSETVHEVIQTARLGKGASLTETTEEEQQMDSTTRKPFGRGR